VVDPGAVRLLHDRGRTVHVWTVNDEASMRRLLGWGVDGLVTDRPDLALRVLGRGPAGGGAEVSPR
jgi:glycerophosphoryl diester phosphodiesterase